MKLLEFTILLYTTTQKRKHTGWRGTLARGGTLAGGDTGKRGTLARGAHWLEGGHKLICTVNNGTVNL